MDKVEFTMNIKESDLRRLTTQKYMVSWRGRLWLVLPIIMFFALVGLIPLYKSTCFVYIAPVIGFLLLVVVRLPFAMIDRASRHTIKALAQLHNLVYWIDDIGFYSKSDETYRLQKWQRFKFVEENRNFIFFHYTEGGYVVLFKFLLSAETIDKIRSVFKEAPFHLHYIRSDGDKTKSGTRVCTYCGDQVVNVKASKSKRTAGLLGICLGWLGIHRFYLGYTKIGIVQILVTIFTCGLGWWWGFIEGLLILIGTIKTDAEGRPLED